MNDRRIKSQPDPQAMGVSQGMLEPEYRTIKTEWGSEILFDVPELVYRGWPYPSQTALKHARKSMLHYRHYMDTRGEVQEATDDMVLGSALHCALLEPELQLQKVALWAGGVRRGKTWDAFRVDHIGKHILTTTMYEQLIGMSRSLRATIKLKDIEGVEVSARSNWSGLPFKYRCDILTPDVIYDIKKVSSSDPFGTDVRKFRRMGYHIQAAAYCHGFDRERFILLCIEDEPPYAVTPMELDYQLIDSGHREAEGLIEQIKRCMAGGNWPGPAPQTLGDPDGRGETSRARFLREHKGNS